MLTSLLTQFRVAKGGCFAMRSGCNDNECNLLYTLINPLLTLPVLTCRVYKILSEQGLSQSTLRRYAESLLGDQAWTNITIIANVPRLDAMDTLS